MPKPSRPDRLGHLRYPVWMAVSNVCSEPAPRQSPWRALRRPGSQLTLLDDHIEVATEAFGSFSGSPPFDGGQLWVADHLGALHVHFSGGADVYLIASISISLPALS